ncbi:hypothetical protein OJAV_G00039840 [Oryzias javanicus]|uniref:Integrase catalytic domain-containing protein n=1 Tax=Oryzias javanicus TaxID=123683 RepID=A0A437DC92_ORYJA|nr:hypothetical protein OJAV_G00039840 [Oryzias javanicus]
MIPFLKINAGVCSVLGIQRSLCAPYHPQTNGLMERLNGTIHRALSKLVRDRANTWDQYLDSVMFGLRTKKQLTTKFSPYYLMFGRETISQKLLKTIRSTDFSAYFI